MRRAFLAFALSLFALGARADDIASISTVANADLPSQPAGTALVALVDVGMPVALHEDSAWGLSAAPRQWERLEWDRPPGVIRGVISGQPDYLLMGPAGEPASIDRLARLDRTANTLATAVERLPAPFAQAVGVSRDGIVWLAGRDAAGQARVRSLNGGRWEDIAPWPGPGSATSLVFQSSTLWLTAKEGTGTRLWSWTRDGGWIDRLEVPGDVVSGGARPIGQAHVLYLLAGADGAVRMQAWHTIAKTWAPPTPQRKATSAAPFGTGFVLAHDAGDFSSAVLESNPRKLAFLDWFIVAIYLGAMLALGVFFYLRAKKGSTADFFVGSRAIPFWAAGVSIYATNTSSISYVAIPAKAFETDWQYFQGKMVTVIGLTFVAVWIVPVLRRLDLVSVFNYLELRFNGTIRMLASALCMFMHVGARMSVVLFLPALAISTITGTDVVWSILLMGVCTIIYTTMGGMRAVVWTDFFQVIVLMGGALFAIGYVFWSLGGDAVFETARVHDKTNTWNFTVDFTSPTIWGFLLLILLDTVLTFPKDQVLMQRTLATSSDKNAGRSIWIFAAVLLPGGFIFYVIGTVLFAYYKAHPERLDPLLPIDATFPLFIAAELPTGVTGLIIAGIFAAAMGTTSSTINSVATLLSVDFYERLAKNVTQQKSVRFAEWMSVVIGVIGIGLALLLSRYDIHSLLDLTIELAGLFGGGFAGAYTLGMFTKRANSQGVAIGIACAIVITLAAWIFNLVHPYFYLAISIGVCITVGYAASYLFPAPTRSLAGLTVRLDRAAEATVPRGAGR